MTKLNFRQRAIDLKEQSLLQIDREIIADELLKEEFRFFNNIGLDPADVVVSHIHSSMQTIITKLQNKTSNNNANFIANINLLGSKISEFVRHDEQQKRLSCYYMMSFIQYVDFLLNREPRDVMTSLNQIIRDNIDSYNCLGGEMSRLEEVLAPLRDTSLLVNFHDRIIEDAAIKIRRGVIPNNHPHVVPFCQYLLGIDKAIIETRIDNSYPTPRDQIRVEDAYELIQGYEEQLIQELISSITEITRRNNKKAQEGGISGEEIYNVLAVTKILKVCGFQEKQIEEIIKQIQYDGPCYWLDSREDEIDSSAKNNDSTSQKQYIEDVLQNLMRQYSKSDDLEILEVDDIKVPSILISSLELPTSIEPLNSRQKSAIYALRALSEVMPDNLRNILFFLASSDHLNQEDLIARAQINQDHNLIKFINRIFEQREILLGKNIFNSAPNHQFETAYNLFYILLTGHGNLFIHIGDIVWLQICAFNPANNPNLTITADRLLFTINHYGVTKSLLDQIVHNYCDSLSDIRSNIHTAHNQTQDLNLFAKSVISKRLNVVKAFMDFLLDDKLFQNQKYYQQYRQFIFTKSTQGVNIFVQFLLSNYNNLDNKKNQEFIALFLEFLPTQESLKTQYGASLLEYERLIFDISNYRWRYNNRFSNNDLNFFTLLLTGIRDNKIIKQYLNQVLANPRYLKEESPIGLESFVCQTKDHNLLQIVLETLIENQALHLIKKDFFLRICLGTNNFENIKICLDFLFNPKLTQNSEMFNWYCEAIFAQQYGNHFINAFSAAMQNHDIKYEMPEIFFDLLNDPRLLANENLRKNFINKIFFDRNNPNKNILLIAIKSNSLTLVKRILQVGVLINNEEFIFGKNGQTHNHPISVVFDKLEQCRYNYPHKHILTNIFKELVQLPQILKNSKGNNFMQQALYDPNPFLINQYLEFMHIFPTDVHRQIICDTNYQGQNLIDIAASQGNQCQYFITKIIEDEYQGRKVPTKVASHIEPYLQDEYQRNILQQAIMYEKVETVVFLLGIKYSSKAIFEDLVTHQDENGYNAIFLAVASNQPEIIDKILQFVQIQDPIDGLNIIFKKNDNSNTAFEEAAIEKKDQIVSTFLKYPAIRHNQDQYKRNIFQRAVLDNKIEVVKGIIQNKEVINDTDFINHKDKFDHNALSLGAYFNRVEIVEELLKIPQINSNDDILLSTNKSGHTPFDLAVLNGNFKIVQKFLDVEEIVNNKKLLTPRRIILVLDKISAKPTLPPECQEIKTILEEKLRVLEEKSKTMPPPPPIIRNARQGNIWSNHHDLDGRSNF